MIRVPFRLVACLCLACLALAACGGSGGSAGSDRQQIENVYKSTFAAMARGDYATACSYFTAREQASVVASAHRVGLNVSSCAGMFTALTTKYGVSRAQLAKTFGAAGKSGKVSSVSIHGDNATAKFTGTTNGKTYTETDALVRQGGKWKADRIISRSPSG
jgi:hypothetical protein